MLTDTNDGYEALMQFLYRAPIGLVQAGIDGAIEMLNPMSSRLLMPLARDGDLSNLFDVLAPVAPKLRDMVAQFTPAGGVVCEALRVEVNLPGRDHVPQFLSLSVLKLDARTLMAAVADVTLETEREQAQLERKLDSAARIDALTQLPNRRAVHEQIERLIRQADGKPADTFAVLFINFDRFRQINDTLGNAAGDRVLVNIAERIRASLRPPTDRAWRAGGQAQMAARIGGDEFVVVLDGLRTGDDALGVAQRLLGALGRPYALRGQEILSNASMGIVLGSDAAGDADAVLRDASIAMEQAKRGGAGHVVFQMAMRERAVRRGDTEGELRRALREQQLFVMYQPVVGLHPGGATDYAAGVEALVRWQHPTRGLVPPIEFIEIAEACGLIGAIGDFVLSTACADFMDWRTRLGARAPKLLAVNLSRAQLAQPGWTDTVRATLESTGMPAQQLQLEVTESLAAQDSAVQERLQQLKALGIKLALDDFGTGYSSLASLHLLPVDTVKIDRSFVSQGDTSAHHRVLIEATVKVARSLGMSTVAEGIETEAQAAVVRELQCDKGQGYLFGRPMASTVLVEWLGQNAPMPPAP